MSEDVIKGVPKTHDPLFYFRITPGGIIRNNHRHCDN